MINPRLVVEDPDEIKFTLTMTFKLRDWKTLSDQLHRYADDYPAMDVIEDIKGMVRKATESFGGKDG